MSVNSKMTALADSIRAKSGAAGLLGLDAMKTSVDSIVTPDETVTYSQVNTTVKSYLNYVAVHPYSPNDYTYSYFDTHTGVSGNDRPLGAAVTVQAGKLAVSDRMGGTALKTVSAGQQTIYNIAPTTDGGDYVNTNASENITGCGHLIPTGSLRMINCPHARNVRDLGGWACDGGTVKYGKIFRGAVPNSSDRGVLVDWLGVGANIDLRGRTEAGGATQSPLGSDVRYYLYDSYAMYSVADKALWKQMLADVFDCVKNGETVYFNCTMGADRTGTFACILEALLGVSQPDLDTDYELTSFYSERKRNGNYQGGTADWLHLISAIKALSGSTFRDKCVNFVASLGFTSAEINAFRAAMIDGNPSTVTPDIGTFTVTNNLTHAASDNNAQSAVEYQPYAANIMPDSGYVISDVSVTMGGADITDTAWIGVKTTLNFAVANMLSHCSSDNTRGDIIAGQMYFANLSAEAGYTLEGATVSITMGGVEVSTQVYENGRISIPNVTGNVIITVTAAPQARVNKFNKNDVNIVDAARINSSGNVVDEGDYPNQLVTGFIPASVGDIVSLLTDKDNKRNGYTGMISFYDSNKTYIAQAGAANANWDWESGNLSGEFTIPSLIQTHDISDVAYIRLCVSYQADYLTSNNIEIYVV